MKVELYKRLMEAQMNRRAMLKGAASAGVVAAAAAGGMGGLAGKASAQDSVRAQIL